MRCLHVIPGVAPRYGGPSQVIFEMGRALTQAGAQVCVATTDADGRGRLPVAIGQPQDYRGVPTIFFRRGLSEAFKYSSGLARWLGAHLSDFDVAHIHAVFSHSSLAAASACRRLRVPYLVRPLGSLDPWSLGRKSLRKRMLRRLGVNAMLRGAAAIHYTTEAEKRLAESTEPPAPGRVIPLGIEPPRPDPERLDAWRRAHPEVGGHPYVLALARIHPKKRLETLIRAFARANANGSPGDWRLVVAGDGQADYLSRLRQIAEAAAPGRVWFAGWLEDPLKSAVVSGAGLVALVSRQENFGVAAAEALVMNVPVLLSRHVNLAEDVTGADAGWVSELDEGELAAALAEALASPEELRRRGRRGGEWARRQFSWPRIARELIDVYAEASAGVCR